MRELITVFHLCSSGELGSAVIAPHAQHILSAVVKLRESVEFAVLEVHGGLEDAVQGALGAVGSVQEGLQQLPAQLEVAGATQVQGEPVLLQLIPRIPGQAGIQERGIRTQPALPALQPAGTGDRESNSSSRSSPGWKSSGL